MMPPGFERAVKLGVGEAGRRYITMDGVPMHRQRPKPQGKPRLGAFAQRFKLVKAGNDGWRR